MSAERREHRYVLTAGAAAVVDLGGFALLDAGGVPVLAAATASFLVANVVNYGLSARYAFAAEPSLRRYPAFLAGSLVGLGVNVAVTGLAAGALGVPDVLAKLVAIGAAFTINFALNALVVFPRQSGGRLER